MQINRQAFLSGIAAIALAGSCGLAWAGSPETHVMTVRLPDGEVEQVRYVGDVPPVVVLGPNQEDTLAVDRALDPSFAMLEQMTAAMDRQAAALMREVNSLMAPGFGDPEAGGFGVLPATAGPGVCMRSVQITYSGDGRAPHVMSRTAGNCGAARDEASPAVMPRAPAPDQAPKVIEVRDARPDQRVVRTAANWQR